MKCNSQSQVLRHKETNTAEVERQQLPAGTCSTGGDRTPKLQSVRTELNT